MNVSRKIIYPIVFLIALTAAIIITKLAQTRFHILPSSPTQSAAPSTPMVTAEEATPITYQVQQSSADFSTGRSYLTLRLERNTNEAIPERLWVWSHYFSPDEPGRRWDSHPVELRNPFASSGNGTSATVNVAGACPMCAIAPGGKKAYYVRVYVSSEPPNRENVADRLQDFNISTATPVLLQGLDKATR